MKSSHEARSWLEISGPALRHNIKAIRQAIPRGTQVIGVVKANAYGHGVAPIAAECVHEGVEWLAVANVTEATELRKHGLKRPVLVLGAVLPEEMAEAVRHGFVLTLSSVAEAKKLNDEARRQRRIGRAHFKVDTGMGRLGCWHEDATHALIAIRTLPHVRLEGLYSHFASPCSDSALTRRQWNLFWKFRNQNPDLFMHCANTDAILPSQQFTADAVRPGIALYGNAGTSKAQSLLRPILTWKSRIVLMRRYGAGRTVSYGATYKLRHAENHAIVAVGYADGYHRLLRGRASVLVNGKRCPVRGRITMDLLIVDVSRAPAAKIGDEVVLIGRQGDAEITAHEMADWAETISYEIFTGIGNRVARTYQGFKSV